MDHTKFLCGDNNERGDIQREQHPSKEKKKNNNILRVMLLMDLLIKVWVYDNLEDSNHGVLECK